MKWNAKKYLNKIILRTFVVKKLPLEIEILSNSSSHDFKVKKVIFSFDETLHKLREQKSQAESQKQIFYLSSIDWLKKISVFKVVSFGFHLKNYNT